MLVSNAVDRGFESGQTKDDKIGISYLYTKHVSLGNKC